jgi:hypothetical protein
MRLRDLNEEQARDLGHPETLTRIAQYELAFRMQMSVPEVMDIAREPQEVRDAYGAQPGESSFANNCLLARRLVEQGVRFVHLFDWGWDFHGTNVNEGLNDGLRNKFKRTDKPVAALIKDLAPARACSMRRSSSGVANSGAHRSAKGRTAESAILGRDHFPDAFTIFLAGGGVKPGITYGETDELGFSVVENKVHIHDLQATIMHLLGFNHEKLTFRFQGRDYRLTDVHGKIVKDILA